MPGASSPNRSSRSLFWLTGLIFLAAGLVLLIPAGHYDLESLLLVTVPSALGGLLVMGVAVGIRRWVRRGALRTVLLLVLLIPLCVMAGHSIGYLAGSRPHGDWLQIYDPDAEPAAVGPTARITRFLGRPELWLGATSLGQVFVCTADSAAWAFSLDAAEQVAWAPVPAESLAIYALVRGERTGLHPKLPGQTTDLIEIPDRGFDADIQVDFALLQDGSLWMWRGLVGGMPHLVAGMWGMLAGLVAGVWAAVRTARLP